MGAAGGAGPSKCEHEPCAFLPVGDVTYFENSIQLHTQSSTVFIFLSCLCPITRRSLRQPLPTRPSRSIGFILHLSSRCLHSSSMLHLAGLNSAICRQFWFSCCAHK